MVARVNLAASDIDLHQKTQRSRGTDLVFQSQATNTASDSVSQVLDSEKGAEELAIEHSTAFGRSECFSTLLRSPIVENGEEAIQLRRSLYTPEYDNTQPTFDQFGDGSAEVSNKMLRK
uniref:Uncharacterized protein n=1 Tax=Psilocybe cubensis TaxID=181762 RepID=A0A8H7XMU1_PSICU